jgi:hypothetical protein
MEVIGDEVQTILKDEMIDVGPHGQRGTDFGLEDGRWYMLTTQGQAVKVVRAYRNDKDRWELVQVHGPEWYWIGDDGRILACEPKYGTDLEEAYVTVEHLIPADVLAKAAWAWWHHPGGTHCIRCQAPQGERHHAGCHTSDGVPLHADLDPFEWDFLVLGDVDDRGFHWTDWPGYQDARERRLRARIWSKAHQRDIEHDLIEEIGWVADRAERVAFRVEMTRSPCCMIFDESHTVNYPDRATPRRSLE